MCSSQAPSACLLPWRQCGRNYLWQRRDHGICFFRGSPFVYCFESSRGPGGELVQWWTPGNWERAAVCFRWERDFMHMLAQRISICWIEMTSARMPRPHMKSARIFLNECLCKQNFVPSLSLAALEADHLTRGWAGIVSQPLIESFVLTKTLSVHTWAIGFPKVSAWGA